MDTMKLWDAVSKTDPKYTKRVNQRGGFTAIAAHSQIMEATRQFGPVGIGWGYETGAPIFEHGMVIVPVTIWHGDRGNWFGPVYGCAEMFGSRPDHDAPKKATTDALTKGLSQLGFNADVFLGLYDDNKYVAELRDEFSEKPSGPEPRTKLDGPHTSKTALKKAIHEITNQVLSATTDAEIDAIVKAAKPTLKQANEAWPELLTGDPNIPEDVGLKGTVERKRAELASGFVNRLIDDMGNCDTIGGLSKWAEQNGDMIDGLNDLDRRLFEAVYQAKESFLIAQKKEAA